MFSYKKNTNYRYGNTSNYILDLHLITKLYNPLLTGDAIRLFNHLYVEFTSQDVSYLLQKNLCNLFDYLSFDDQAFDNARKNLEALSLLTTYVNENEIIFCLNKPLNYFEFVKNKNIKDLLISKIGRKAFDSLEVEFNDLYVCSDWKNKSISFDDFFNNENKCINNQILKSITEFKQENSLDNEIAILLEKDIFITQNIDDIDKYLNIYECFDSYDFLKNIINNELSENDIKIINMLINEYNFKKSIINMMIHYSIRKTHFLLNDKYMIKMANTFIQNRIFNIKDAYVFLKKLNTINLPKKIINKKSIDKKIENDFTKNISIENNVDLIKNEQPFIKYDEEDFVELNIDWA